MVKLMPRRRSQPPATPATEESTQHPYSTKVEQAAERAADATRTAAAAAAKRAHARPRTSLLAGLSLVLATAAVLTVAAGTLPRLGIAVGGLAVLVAVAGLAATARRSSNRLGRTEAMVALLLALAAVVVGSLAAAGALSWLDPDTDQLARLRDWLPGWLT